MTSPFPLFDSEKEFRSARLGVIGSQATAQLSQIVRGYTQRDWANLYLEIARDFLKSHLPDQGNHNTFNRFKSEIERFTLWLSIKHKKNPLELQDTDIIAYLNFLKNPDRTWVSAEKPKRIVVKEGKYVTCDDWCPFWARTPKGVKRPEYDPQKTTEQNREIQAIYNDRVVQAYLPKATTLAAALRALSAFYNYLIKHQLEVSCSETRGRDNSRLISDKIRPNPVIQAKKQFKKHETNQKASEAFGSSHCLTQRQWKFTLDAANEMRLANPDRWTRAWFLIAFIKVSLLRVSDLCRSTLGTPKMRDVKHNPELDCWVFQIKHKEKFEREVVLPDGFLEYIKVYRRSRGFSSDTPQPCDQEPLISKLPRWDKPGTVAEGKPDMSILPGIAREDIDAVFKYTQSYVARQEIMQSKSFIEDIEVLSKASAHWLRHTGASMALDDGVDLIALQNNLGHGDLRLTQDHYIDLVKRSSIEQLKSRKI